MKIKENYDFDELTTLSKIIFILFFIPCILIIFPIAITGVLLIVLIEALYNGSEKLNEMD